LRGETRSRGGGTRVLKDSQIEKTESNLFSLEKRLGQKNKKRKAIIGSRFKELVSGGMAQARKPATSGNQLPVQSIGVKRKNFVQHRGFLGATKREKRGLQKWWRTN